MLQYFTPNVFIFFNTGVYSVGNFVHRIINCWQKLQNNTTNLVPWH